MLHRECNSDVDDPLKLTALKFQLFEDHLPDWRIKNFEAEMPKVAREHSIDEFFAPAYEAVKGTIASGAAAGELENPGWVPPEAWSTMSDAQKQEAIAIGKGG